MRYAENTSVSVERSKAEIESLLIRRGAKAFQSGWADGQAAIGFILNDRTLRFKLPIPSKEDPAFNLTPGRGRKRDSVAAEKAWEQACRSRWRALLLAIKAKLEAVDAGISIFDREFLAFIVDPASGQTIGDEIEGQLELNYQNRKSGRPIALLEYHK